MTGETLERVETPGGPLYECVICGGRSPTRLPNHDLECLVVYEGDDVTVHNRPAVLERAYESVARVRYQDNGTLEYVDHDAVEVDTDA